VVGLDLFTSKKYDEIFTSTEQLSVPNMERTEWELIDVGEDECLKLLKSDGSKMKEDIHLSDLKEEVVQRLEQLKSGIDTEEECVVVTILRWMNQELVVAVATRRLSKR